MDLRNVETKAEPEQGSAGTDESIPTVDPTKTHVAQDFKHESPLISCRFDPSGKYAFAGAQDFAVWRWDLSSGQKTAYSAVESWVRGIAFSQDGRTMLTGGYDGRLIWWPVDATKPEPIRTVEAHDGWLRALAVSSDHSLVATVGNDRLVKLWRMDDGSLVREMTGHESYVYNVAFHPDGKQLVTGDLKCRLIHWDVTNGKLQREWTVPSLFKYDTTFRADIGGFRGMTFAQTGDLLAVSGITNVTNAFACVGNPSVVIFDWAKGEQKIDYLTKNKPRAVAWGVALHPQGFAMAAAGGPGGGYLLFWRADQQQEFHQFKLPNTARDLSLHPDGLQLATAHYDGHLRICKMTSKA